MNKFVGQKETENIPLGMENSLDIASYTLVRKFISLTSITFLTWCSSFLTFPHSPLIPVLRLVPLSFHCSFPLFSTLPTVQTHDGVTALDKLHGTSCATTVHSWLMANTKVNLCHTWEHRTRSCISTAGMKSEVWSPGLL